RGEFTLNRQLRFHRSRRRVRCRRRAGELGAMNALLLSKHLGESDTAALGADLASRYGLAGSFSGRGFDPVHGMLASGLFNGAPRAPCERIRAQLILPPTSPR